MKISLTFCSVVAIIAVVSVTPSRSDYCSLCPGHIGCKHNNLFDAACPRDAKMVTMTDALKKLLIDGHNEKRNIVAGGGGKNLRPACAMPVMKWDNELAELAALNVKQCQPRHDKCHDTPTFQISGQNIALKFVDFDGPVTFNDAELFQVAIDSWYAEIQNTNQQTIDAYRPNNDGKKNGHFTVMMSDKNTHLGCAAATYQIGTRYNHLLTCNYAYDNVVTTPVYESCDSPATKCTSGKHNLYNNLCVA